MNFDDSLPAGLSVSGFWMLLPMGGPHWKGHALMETRMD